MKNFGVVKWFGGYNSRTERENNFGFVIDVSGIEAFLHKNALVDGSSPSEKDFLFLQVEPDSKRKDKWTVKKAIPPEDKSITIKDIYQAANQLVTKPQSAIPIQSITKHYESKLLSASSKELCDHITEAGSKAVLAMLGHQYRGLSDQIRLNEILLNTGLVKPFYDIPVDELSDNWIKNNQQTLVNYLNSLDDEACLSVFRDIDHILPSQIVIYLVAKGVIKSCEQLGDRRDVFKKYTDSILSDNTGAFPEFLQTFIEQELTSKGGLKSVPMIREYLDESLFKKYLYEKNPNFITLFSDSVYLQKHLDLFILHTLFSLVHAGHTQEEIYNGFMELFWRAIMTGRYDLEDQEQQILRLFPPCHTIYQRKNHENNSYGGRSALSCEAVYWDKQDMFLCRGTPCRSPQILGSETDDYEEFSIFDWFRHYQIDYLNHKQPSKKDFPIKLAGYINRMREIFDVLHCRSCGTLMTPDLAYARTQQVKYENGIPVLENLAAAYRLTVFRCAEASCEEYDKGHYINHCLNFYCHDLIDSRDSTTRCDNGLLICRHCASCCSQHDKSNPVGLCPECGCDLKLFRDPDKRNAYNDRFVACTSASCDFIFESEQLPKKFTKLKGVQVMSARPKEVCCSNSSHHPTLGEQPPFYCEEDLSRY